MMIISIFILTACLSFPTIGLSAEFYKWIDKDGGVHYVDSLDKVPSDVIGKEKSIQLNDDRNGVNQTNNKVINRKSDRQQMPLNIYDGIDKKYNKHIPNEKPKAIKTNNIEGIDESELEAEKKLIAMANSLLRPDSQLSNEAKGYVPLMLIAGIPSSDIKEALRNVKTDEDMGEVLEYMSISGKKQIGDIIGETNNAYDSPESTWRIHKNALINGDLESALNCLTPTSAYKHREIFRSFKRGDIIKIGGNLNQISKVYIEGNIAQYRQYLNVQGKNITQYVELVRLNGNWKIKDY